MLILNRNREAEHYNLGVTGTTGASMIHVMGAHDGNGASNGNGNYIQWSNQGSTAYPVSQSSTTTDGFHFVVWGWTNQSNSGTNMHGLSTTPAYNEDGLSADELRTQLQLVRDGNWGTYAVFAISTHGYIASNSDLLDEMHYIRSQYWPKQIGSSPLHVNKAYAAIGTSHHGIIAESLDGRSSSAFCEYHFGAMDHDKIGYAGYGRDYLVGKYMSQNQGTTAGTTSLVIQDGNTTATASSTDCIASYTVSSASGSFSQSTTTGGGPSTYNIQFFGFLVFNEGVSNISVGDILYLNNDAMADPAFTTLNNEVVTHINVTAVDVANDRIQYFANDFNFTGINTTNTGATNVGSGVGFCISPASNPIVPEATFNLRDGETIRLTGECKVEDDSLRTGGSLVFTLGQSGATASTYTCTSNEWQPFEIYYTKPVGNSNAITLSTTYTAGSTTDGNGWKYRALSVHRCGFGVSAAAQTDQVLGGHTLTGSDIVESIGPFKLGKSGDFINFWNSSRNLYNPFYVNQHNPAANSEATRFFDVNHNGASPQSDAERVFKMCDNGPNSNMTHSFYIPGTSSQFETVDHTKMYFAAFWVRVHSMGFSTSIAPSRIEVLAHAKNSTNNDVNMDKADGTTMASNKEMSFMSVSGGSPAQGIGNDSVGWKLYGGWFLPSWMTDQQIADWKTNHWQKWAGDYNLGTSSADSGFNGATGELVASDMAYLARMNSAVAKIQLELSFQLHTSVPINARVAYPFMLEVDPMNFTEDGRIFFWDFLERNVPSL